MIAPYAGPDPGDDQVLVRVEACVAGLPELRAFAAGRVVPGGAAVGVVERAGAACADLASVRVVVQPLQPCGDCEACRTGDVAACPDRRVLGETVDGAMADRVLVDARWLCRIDGDLSVPGPAAAVLGRDAACAYAAFIRSGARPGAPIAITGDNAAARLLLDLARAHGSEPAPGATPAIDTNELAYAHPDLLPELAALAVKGDVDLEAAADVARATDLADTDALAARVESAAAQRKALVLIVG